MDELLIYTPTLTPRLEYIFQLFFDTLLPTPYSITHNPETVAAYPGAKLNYSDSNLAGNILHIIPHGLLAEVGIQPHHPEVSEWKGTKIFFKTEAGDLPFDIFSAAFFMVSRYEEYLHHKPDEHLRFHHTDALAYKHNFLDEPLVNLWAGELKKLLMHKFPSLKFGETHYRFTPTIDIDVAYAHLGRNTGVTLGAYAKSLSKLQFTSVLEKSMVLLHLKTDPYDTYAYQKSVFRKYSLQPIYFFLAGERGPHDKNISTGSRYFKKLVQFISSYAAIGIHPSYQSDSNPAIVSKEIAKVEQHAAKKISQSRQHFLRVCLPETYRCLAQLGITDDFTMAFAGVPGFRAGICTPFFFYDLQDEKTLPVRLHSSIVMDGTLNEYLKLDASTAIATAVDLLKKVQQCNGEFILIWHNHSLSETSHWKGWKRVFESIIAAAA